MCLTISGKFNKKISNTLFVPQKRDYDIRVYKVLELMRGGGFRTPYKGVEIEFDENGQKVLVADRFFDDEYVTVHHGIHAYYSRERAEAYALDIVGYNWFEMIFPAVIPAGTKFYIGDNGDIVAERMIIFGDPLSWIFYEGDHHPLSVYRTDDEIPEEVPENTDDEIPDEFPR